jgi:hypothetical protein
MSMPKTTLSHAEAIKLHLRLANYHAHEANSTDQDIFRRHHANMSEYLALEAKRIAEMSNYPG